MFTHIIAASDGSDAGRDAVALAHDLSTAAGAGLWLVGVYAPSLLPVPGQTDRKTLSKAAERCLRRERQELAPEAIVSVVADNFAARGIRHYAVRTGGDLVVLGSGADTRDGHAAAGRDGRQVLTDAPFSVALAQRGYHARRGALSRITVGYDGSAEAERAVSLAARIARTVKGELHLATVVSDGFPALWGAALAREYWEALCEGDRRQALADAERRAAALDVPTRVTAAIGDPGHELGEAARTSDLLVIGSRRWGAWARLVTGGAGETLVNGAASCSLLIVPRPQRLPAPPTVRRQRLRSSGHPVG